MWLLDTVALSEAAKPRANTGYVSWLETIPAHDIHTSVLCLGEIRRGIEMLPVGAKRKALAHWLENDLISWLEGRILPVDGQIAQTWGRLGARGKVSPIDALIGATAASAGLTVVTRNARDFDGLGVPVLNPWF
ncbi:MAG: type II toxin-antitoxin system VapC family toxin [Brevundimonas sp.]|uniref:type II toxin-antitoxin system VapC family toxin n=1 Tax=Brevundimonas sp. TaxID=1871086 RepID=UPI002734470E|nr:type II toxin-antitoxin system VapC family toxin [Brevundimonas sp.]MDP3658393.1 type II toxin-antitoxin system VapC family toxin [Brevundimonas sp.]MDZ4109633.1 type II toxin-antitoxin system VapC family toxin [Brevundimonas sp.]